MKYIMFAYTFAGIQRLFFILFPDQLVHSEVAGAIRYMKHGTERNWVRAVPVSAGSVMFDDIKGWVAYGSSESLGLRVHEQDSLIINSFPHLHGLGFAERPEDEEAGSKRIGDVLRKGA